MSSRSESSQANSSTESTDGGSRTASQETFTVNETSQGKQYLRIPHTHMAAAGLEEGDSVGITPVNYNGRFALALDDDDSIGISRSLRASRTQEPESLLTIPKRVATAAGLTGDAVRYNSDEGRIVAFLDHDSRFGEIEVYNVDRQMMSRWKSGVYAYQIPEDVYRKVQPGETVWFWYDVIGDDFIFVLESDEASAPEGAVELNVQYTEKAKSDYLVHLPKQVCDALGLSGAFMKWGHDGERLLGLLSK